MAHVNNLIHCVWSTKRRFPFISEANRPVILDHIREYAAANEIHIDFINAHKNHIHCLLSIEPGQNLSAVIKVLKGETSRWISENIPSCGSFGWGGEYYAVSVSPRMLERVREYIRNQDTHHAKRSWADEEQFFLQSIVEYGQASPQKPARL